MRLSYAAITPGVKTVLEWKAMVGKTEPLLILSGWVNTHGGHAIVITIDNGKMHLQKPALYNFWHFEISV
jgi:hypothetical protein